MVAGIHLDGADAFAVQLQCAVACLEVGVCQRDGLSVEVVTFYGTDLDAELAVAFLRLRCIGEKKRKQNKGYNLVSHEQLTFLSRI